MAKMILVSIHGFRSSSETFNVLDQVVKNSFDEYIPVDWGAAISDLFPIERMQRLEIAIAEKIELASDILSSLINNRWFYKLLNRKESAAKETAIKINSSIEVGGDVVIIAHSLGTVLLYEIIKRLRRDINIYFVCFGGVMNSEGFSELLKRRKNILSGVNFYSPEGDRIVNTIYLNLSQNKEPIGTCKVNSIKCINVRTNKGHCDYLNADFFYYYYYYIILILKKKLTLKLLGSSELSFDSEVSFSEWAKYEKKSENFKISLNPFVSKIISGVEKSKKNKINTLLAVFNMDLHTSVQIETLDTHGGNWFFWNSNGNGLNSQYNIKGDGWVSSKNKY